MGFGKITALLRNQQTTKIRNLTSNPKAIIGSKNGQIQQQSFPYDLLNQSNYKAGVICTAYQLNDRSRDQIYADRNSITGGTPKVLDKIMKNKFNKNALANIFLPHQKTMAEAHNFNYSEGKDGWLTTLQQKGLSGVVGQTVFGVIDDVTGGIFGDQYGEVIDKRTKLMFNDAEPRQMIYLNTFTFRNINDLIAFAEIYFLFTYLAYPQLDNSGGVLGDKVKELVNEAKRLYDNFSPGMGDNSLLLSGLEQITNFSVIKVPCVWRIQNFVKQETEINSGDFKVNTGSILPQSTFGPAVITSVRFNKTPNQVFNSFRAFPNDPVQVEVEITFKELFPLRRDQIWDK